MNKRELQAIGFLYGKTKLTYYKQSIFYMDKF